jgi:hypothetical protein
MKMAEHVARMGEMGNTYKILVEILKGRDLSKDGRKVLT